MRAERIRRRAVGRYGLPGLAFALIALGAGCAMVPANSSPRLADEGSGRDTLSRPYVRMIAESPKPNASPEDIVRGFLAAIASFDDPQLTIARQYLTEEAAVRWNPWRTMRVYEGRISMSVPAAQLARAQETSVTLRGTAVATIDPEGRYTPASGEVEETFTLVKVGGEWRIASAPNERLLSTDDLQRAFRAVDLYFPPTIPAYGLVRDRVWVPIDPARGLPETLVRRLLAGPTKPIADAVSTAFPPGTDVNQISVEGDTVVVDFTSAIESVPLTQMEAMKAQLAWTLGDLATGRTIEIRVNGEPFRDGGLRFRPADYARFDPDAIGSQPQAYYMQRGRLHRVKEKGGGEPVAGAAGEPGTAFIHPAVSADDPPMVAALVAGDGIYTTTMARGVQWQRWIAGKDLTPPSWDRYGAVWTAEWADGRTRVWEGISGQARRVFIPEELAAERVAALRVSRDGARVAMIIEGSKGRKVKIGTIIRQGQQSRIDNVFTLIDAQEGQEIKVIAWQGSAELLVLTKGKGGQELATWSVMEGMPVPDAAIKLDAQAEIDRIAAAPDHVLAAVDVDGDPKTADSEVRSYDADKRTWTPIAKDGATDPIYPLG